jgi:gliding motility-associated-like protein
VLAKFTLLYRGFFKFFLLLILLSGVNKITIAQCPPNIDFEEGTFNGWQCWVGHTYVSGNKNDIRWDVPPINTPVNPGLYPGRFQMLSSFPGNGLDPFGQFPVNCPNGSGHSIKLGNQSGGHEAEGASYTFTIPPGQNQFNIIFHYAVVFQGPQHATFEQPRLVIDVRNVTDNVKIDCSSFDFFKDTSSTALPGFFLSTNNPTGTPVWCKNWSATSVKLDGYAGKTIQLFFKTADCIFTAHFGYAYVDVNTECSSSFVGAAYCPDDTAINVTAPYGYQFYKWWDIANPTIPLATTQTINFTPPPPSGTTLKVALEPYNGYGCPDTLTVQLLDTLSVFANAGPDRLSCQNAPVQIGTNSSPGFVYSWSPVTGLSNPNISNPIATPSVTTEYVLTVRNFGGGCLSTDTVIVKGAVLDNSIQQTGISTYCFGDPQAAVLHAKPADSIQWYRNNIAIAGANDTLYNVVQTGTYHATVFSFVGCSLATADIAITVNPVPVVGFASNAQDQCFNNHQFIFTDTSKIAFGTLNYSWDMGDVSPLLTSQNVTYSYALPGTYIVKQKVVSNFGCTDSVSYTVHVFDSPVAGFDADIKGTCFKNNSFKFTNSSTLAVGAMKYLWDFGDSNTDTTRDVTHSYTQPNTYTVRLTVISDKGCPNDSAFNITVHPDPSVDFKEPNNQQCFGNNLFNFVNNSTILTGSMQYLWSFGDGATDTTRDAAHSYAGPGDFMVKMVVLSNKGCTDSTSKPYKVFKYAFADFKVDPICINLRLPLFNQTINTSPFILTYLWEFGNGATSTVQNPVYSYPDEGLFTIKLSVSSVQCPQTISVKKIDVLADLPARGIKYSDVEAVMNFPEKLKARQIGNTVLWTPALNLDFTNSYRPSFKGLASQLYYVQLKTSTGCLTVDTQFVKIIKKIKIYVPKAFTPDGNGVNEYLYPTLMGFKKLNSFRVFDRWGKLLFASQTERPGWDGRINGNLQETKTVVWMVEAVDVDGVTHREQGTTIILR